jgi:hypothetical protein
MRGLAEALHSGDPAFGPPPACFGEGQRHTRRMADLLVGGLRYGLAR